MTCSFCGGSTAPYSVSTSFERPNAAVAWVCKSCGRADRPEPRKISDEVWEQLRERSASLPHNRETRREQPKPRKVKVPRTHCTKRKHPRSEHGRYYQPEGRSGYWVCTACVRERRDTPEYKEAQNRYNRRYEFRKMSRGLTLSA